MKMPTVWLLDGYQPSQIEHLIPSPYVAGRSTPATIDGMSDLIAMRFKSFGWSLLMFVVGAIAAAFASPDFAALVNEHFGGSALGTLILLVVTELVKHARNKWQLGRLGTDGRKVILI